MRFADVAKPTDSMSWAIRVKRARMSAGNAASSSSTTRLSVSTVHATSLLYQIWYRLSFREQVGPALRFPVMRRAAIVSIGFAASSCMPPEWGANAVLHPYRKPLTAVPDIPYDDVAFTGQGGIAFRGWRFRASGERRGMLVYLHGIGDNRAGGIGLAKRFGPKGWEVLAYDGRAQGASGGDACTYGVLEKGDLSKALDALKADRVVLFGSSLGAAVALQAAPLDARIARRDRGVAVLQPRRGRARPRALVCDGRGGRERAHDCRAKGGFDVDDAAPVALAPRIRVPVLLIHGERDRDTRPEHSRRIEAALTGPKRLLIVPGAGHDDTLRGAAVWAEIEAWLSALSSLS